MNTYRTEYLDQDNRRLPKTDRYCIACHKDIKPVSKCFQVHLVDGGPFVLHPQNEDAYRALPESERRGDMGFFEIGPDCAKKLGMEWIWENPHG